MKNPFEAVIEFLHKEFDDQDGYELTLSARAAIRLLEVAGKVDKDKALTAWHWLHSESAFCPPAVPDGSRDITSLLAALPPCLIRGRTERL